MACVVFLPLIIVGYLLAMISAKASGIYTSYRVGENGKLFKIYKLRSMYVGTEDLNTLTTSNDPRITKIGRWLRKFKIDELPQLWNVLKGNMSLVGPRPDVKGYADELKGEDRIILTVKPGITGLATIMFKNEEDMLAQQEDPYKYNRNVIWPKKVQLNKKYVRNYSFKLDILILLRTFFSKVE
ncbi:Sugar transferase involved in LPS biosynthesis (colanic, teichoic acid) [Aequorivita viscosa]|uniref:Sugar transferase involved in LPS biosynthesis (Colanic, teichoic acid) n=1 Tax=Aequorivita viscosa TaxID=797419 RepID=A0A1M6FMN5_9FLAO|nr:Sugar transferase involved in LPS biosynthesis (colanic, teichoic acid) [Aequorivita viscosa]SHI98869.1 Sugar transferase involved in LPS biosynthesis (colanic, teichoic acid) [Aequorivita viscosa]